ncbi:MAG: hypothetical protein OQK01_03945 [Xanthomonadales bacterium]|jgi:hypothetical protein|nr:hypothetical protein [Xanthomonadales bacterium]
MLTRARFRLLLLALMVAVSHVALVSHVTAHFQPNLDQCELCVSQAHPLAAIPAAESQACAECGPMAGLPTLVTRSCAVVVTHPYQQRAPPVLSS